MNITKIFSAAVALALTSNVLAEETIYDVVIYGSSPAAITAAMEAGRHGKKAVIVCPEKRIGGLTTGGLGQTDIGNKSAFGGFALQFYKNVAAYYRDEKNWKQQKRSDYLPDGQCAGSQSSDSMWTFEPHAALTLLEFWEKACSLKIERGEYLDRSATGVTKEGAKIVSFKTLSGKVYRGKTFVDATYEGDLLAAAGVSYIAGREDNSQYNETISGVQCKKSVSHQLKPGIDPYVKKGDPSSGLLPHVEPYDPNLKDGTGDKRIQAYCFRMCLTDDPENRIPFAKPEGYDELEYELLFRNCEAGETCIPWINSKMPNRKTDTNNRCGFSTDFIGCNWNWAEGSYEEREKIYNAHLKYQRGLMWTLANHPRVPEKIRAEVSKWGTCRDEFQDGPGDGWQSQLYVREGRRMIGDYVMTEAHCRHKAFAPRPVALGAYTMDSHNVRRYVGKDGFVHNEGNIEDYETLRLGPYPIDYGSLIPKKSECVNLYVPVCISATHMAFGSIRMEPVFFALGQVAGLAASLSIESDCAAQDVDYSKLREILDREGQKFGQLESPHSERIECESFKDFGGWKNDTQFMDQMGSPFLLAHGMGKPVANAKTTFKVPGASKYWFSVRTRDWTAPWSKAHAGTFRLIVDGKPFEKVLGTVGDGEWVEEDVGAIELHGGTHTLELEDLTGFDGRCDSVVIKSSPNMSCFGSYSSVASLAEPYDLVVVGGGIAGICSAVSAARLGLRTALIHDRPVLGGNNSSEVRVHLGAWQNMPPYPRLGDIVAEIGPEKEGNARPKATYEDEKKLAVVKAEKNLDLFLEYHVDKAITNAQGVIEAVSAVHTREGVHRTFSGKRFVDCTGDGTVGFLAGADYRMGREAKSEHNEPWAPEKPDMLTLGSSVQWYADKTDDGSSVAFAKQPWMLELNESNCSTGLRGDWWWETGLGRDQIKEAEYIRDYGLLVAYSNWAFLKNSSSKRADYADKELKWVAYIAGRRESRRLMGDFILTEKILQDKEFQDDGTCATTWTIDLHFPKSKEATKFEGEPFQTDSLNEVIWAYPVPYRCLYSRNVPNLFMAGRDISVSHIALGTTRLMRTHGMMGEVVGMAASLCKKYDCTPRDVYKSHLDELKELMKKGVGDGKVHAPQMYNIQDSLDPVFKDKKAGNHQVK